MVQDKIGTLGSWNSLNSVRREFSTVGKREINFETHTQRPRHVCKRPTRGLVFVNGCLAFYKDRASNYNSGSVMCFLFFSLRIARWHQRAANFSNECLTPTMRSTYESGVLITANRGCSSRLDSLVASSRGNRAQASLIIYQAGQKLV